MKILTELNRQFRLLNNSDFAMALISGVWVMGGMVIVLSAIKRPPGGSLLVATMIVIYVCGIGAGYLLPRAIHLYLHRLEDSKRLRSEPTYEGSLESTAGLNQDHLDQGCEALPQNPAGTVRNIEYEQSKLARTPEPLNKVLQIMHNNWSDINPKRMPKQVNIAREIDAALGWGKKGNPSSEPSRDAKTIAKLIKPDFVTDTDQGTDS